MRRAAADREVARLERLSGSGLAHRRFYRVHLAAGEPATLIARVDRGEPAPGVPAEPPLEATRAFLEAARPAGTRAASAATPRARSS